MNTYPYRTYAQIDLDKMQHNLRQVRSAIGPDCRLLFVLKADAYGHGAPMCAKYSEELVDWYAVATMDEALSIRAAGVKKPVLLFGALQDTEIVQAADCDITINTVSLEYSRHVAQVLQSCGKTIDCHIKIDTGMNRTGLFARVGRTETAVAQAEEIFSLAPLHVTGINTHFSCADSSDPADIAFTDGQYAAFRAVADALQEKGYDVGLRHCTSTCAFLCHPDWKLDMIRVGMLGFGQSMDADWAQRMGLQRIMRWCAKVISVLELAPGESVSYGRIYRTTGHEKIAVISAGYADGYNRSYSNRAGIIINDHLVPQCAKVCMDYTMANVTGVDVKPGDDAILLGRSQSCEVTPDSLSAATEYGVNGWTTCQITARVPRIYVYHGEIVETRMLLR